MVSEINAKGFNWRECPFCGCTFERRCDICGVVKTDDLGVRDIKVQCRSCGVVYIVERVISWQARKVASGKPLSQEVDEFLVDRERRLVEAHKRLFNI